MAQSFGFLSSLCISGRLFIKLIQLLNTCNLVFCISRPVKTEIKKINKEQHFNFEVERPPQDDYGEEIVVV